MICPGQYTEGWVWPWVRISIRSTITLLINKLRLCLKAGKDNEFVGGREGRVGERGWGGDRGRVGRGCGGEREALQNEQEQ